MTIADPLPFACLECGDRFATRDHLESHWFNTGHGPSRVQDAALHAARLSVGRGDDAGVEPSHLPPRVR